MSDLNEPEHPQRFGRRYGHNLPLFVEIHQQLVELASDTFGEKVKPSYAFLSLYENNGKCPLHRDRPQCRYTIDYLIQQESELPWPLVVSDSMTDDEVLAETIINADTDAEKAEVIKEHAWTECLLYPNDATCYSGTHAWHYRPTRSVGFAHLAFFHFVPEAFNGPLD